MIAMNNGIDSEPCTQHAQINTCTSNLSAHELGGQYCFGEAGSLFLPFQSCTVIFMPIMFEKMPAYCTCPYSSIEMSIFTLNIFI